MIPALGFYAVFFLEPFYPWLLMIAVALTSLIVGHKG